MNQRVEYREWHYGHGDRKMGWLPLVFSDPNVHGRVGELISSVIRVREDHRAYNVVYRIVGIANSHSVIRYYLRLVSGGGEHIENRIKADAEFIEQHGDNLDLYIDKRDTHRALLNL